MKLMQVESGSNDLKLAANVEIDSDLVADSVTNPRDVSLGAQVADSNKITTNSWIIYP
ncbi:hypothetical protein D9M70_441720 [compost metagenome]